MNEFCVNLVVKLVIHQDYAVENVQHMTVFGHVVRDHYVVLTFEKP